MTKRKKINANSAIGFCKAEATGNDFVIIDLREPLTAKKWAKILKKHSLKTAVKKICDRHFGIGADGVVLLNEPRKKQNDLSWKFLNSDGSEADMCGNASRCVGLFESERRKKAGPFRLETKAGVIILRRTAMETYIRCQFPEVKVLKKRMRVKGKKKTWDGIYINSGVPHFVVEIKSFADRVFLAAEAEEIKYQKPFGRGGTNVTFVGRNGTQFFTATHERGVEDFTLSCGTGAVAVARFLAEKYGQHRGSRLLLPGGSVEVNLQPQTELVGPAHLVFWGEYAL